jgi:hypothetical protein
MLKFSLSNPLPNDTDKTMLSGNDRGLGHQFECTRLHHRLIKEIGSMRTGMIVLLAALVVVGCVHMDVKKNIDAINAIRRGDSQAQVLQQLGPPAIRHDIDEHRMVAFYRTNTDGGASVPVTETLCTAVAFEDGRVVSVGDDPTDRWRREAAEEKRLAQIAEHKRSEAQQAEAARQKAEAKRQAKIAELEAAVRPVPAHNAELNLKYYRQLHELDPMNERYRKKVAIYEKRLAYQHQQHDAKARIAAERKARGKWEKERDTRNKRLRQYTGNGIAEMAVHDMGNGSLYVWIKNVSNQVITTHPDYFTLLDTHDKRIVCQISDSLDSVLEPGSISHGKIDFDKSVVPGRLIFENNEAKRIEKSLR